MEKIAPEFDDSDTRALRLTGFKFGDLGDVPQVGTIRDAGPIPHDSRSIMFQMISQTVALQESIAPTGQFLRILAPVSTGETEDLEVPHVEESEVWSGLFTGYHKE